jgi:hypothetical protein
MKYLIDDQSLLINLDIIWIDLVWYLNNVCNNVLIALFVVELY